MDKFLNLFYLLYLFSLAERFNTAGYHRWRTPDGHSGVISHNLRVVSHLLNIILSLFFNFSFFHYCSKTFRYLSLTEFLIINIVYKYIFFYIKTDHLSFSFLEIAGIRCWLGQDIYLLMVISGKLIFAYIWYFFAYMNLTNEDIYGAYIVRNWIEILSK